MPLLPGPRLPEKSTTPPLPTVNCAVPPLLLPRNSVLPPVFVVMMASPAVAAFWNSRVPLPLPPTVNIGAFAGVPELSSMPTPLRASEPPLLIVKV